MPTENKSSNEQVMASVPFQRENRYIVIKRKDLEVFVKAEQRAVRDFLRRIQASLVEKGAPDRECLALESDWPEYEQAWAAIEARMTGKPIEQHQGEPVALPARKKVRPENPAAKVSHTKGWNACLDEIAKLGPLYTHPAPSSLAIAAETLRAVEARIDARQVRIESAAIIGSGEVERLRTQLAEREALLREIREKGAAAYTSDFWSRLNSALSASAGPGAAMYPKCSVLKDVNVRYSNSTATAEPSAPTVRDERAEFEAWHPTQYGKTIGFNLDAWRAWQARAALERKP